MSGIPQWPVALDDAMAYTRQVGAGRFARVQAAALLHLYAYRGRVLCPATRLDHDLDGTVDQTTTDIASAVPFAVLYTRRSEVDRPVLIVPTLTTDRGRYGVSRENLSIGLGLHVTVADYNDANDDEETLSSMLAAPELSYPEPLAYLLHRPARHVGSVSFVFRSTLASSEVEAKWSLRAGVSGVDRFAQPRITSVLMFEEPPANTQSAT